MTASPPPVLPDERLAAGIARLAVRYRGHFSPETIQRLITDSYERLAEHARIRIHLVVLAEHLATERL
ncbi:arsenate reductase ArsC, partial [Streptomyces althioticus]|uniref:three-helix bundle dimerization domain-containing protein n=1 Tax=Streptomyces althioticus TaxID=83380 RepID=UPI0034214516